MVGLHGLWGWGVPPSRYPDLFTLGITGYSCLHFLGAYLHLCRLLWGNSLLSQLSEAAEKQKSN